MMDASNLPFSAIFVAQTQGISQKVGMFYILLREKIAMQSLGRGKYLSKRDESNVLLQEKKLHVAYLSSPIHFKWSDKKLSEFPATLRELTLAPYGRSSPAPTNKHGFGIGEQGQCSIVE